MTKSERWILSEWYVACDRAARYSESVLDHRLKTPFAEIDLVTCDDTNGIKRIFEVKSWNEDIFGSMWGPELLGFRQRKRLLRAYQWQQARDSHSRFSMSLAVVRFRRQNAVAVDYVPLEQP